MIELKNEKIAVPVVLFAGLLWSFGPLVVRYMEDPHLVPWQYIFGRGLTIFIILNLYLYFEEGLNFYKNYKKVVEIHSQANMLGENISHDHLAQAIRAISTPILNKPIGEVSLAKLLGQILTLSKEFKIEVQPQFTLLQKTMLMAEGTTRQINPNINMWNLSRPLIEKWINEADDPFKIFEDWVQKNKLALLKIPELIEKFDEFLSKKMN